MKKKTFPLEQVKILIEEEKNIQQIAEIFNTSRTTMSKFLKENNLQTKKQKQLQHCISINEKEICEKYENGYTILELSKMYNVSTIVIKDRLKRNDISIRSNSESHRKYSLDENYFDIIDTPNKAYVLGFICADGCISDRNELIIGLSLKDIDWINFFKEELKSERPLQFKETSCEIRINSKKICDDLKNYEILPRKSLTLNIKNVIDKASLKEPYLSLFLLGYFDGGIYHFKKEGYTEQYCCSITGTYETCEYFKEYFHNVGFFHKRFPERKNNNTTYQIGGKNLVYKSLSKLYENSSQLSFFLKRKKNIFDSIKGPDKV